MFDNEFGMSPIEIDELHLINAETAAHNIALAYIQSVFKSSELSTDELDLSNSVFTIAKVYADAYNYAYNFINYENKINDESE